MRSSVRPGVRINLALGFSRIFNTAPDTQKVGCFANCLAISPDKPIPWRLQLLKRKENSSRECRRCLRVCLCYHTLSTSWFRNVNLIPFRSTSQVQAQRDLGTEFSYLLGPTHPCTFAVHMEPFSTSVFKVLI